MCGIRSDIQKKERREGKKNGLMKWIRLMAELPINISLHCAVNFLYFLVLHLMDSIKYP
jgi:hypothetical protein